MRIVAGKKSDLGPAGMAVAHNVLRLRKARNTAYAELSRRLSDIGREIPPLGLRRIESGDRRVDADDLVALAVALGVSPVTLLMPVSDSPDDLMPATGIDRDVTARQLWDWITAAMPLAGDTADVVAEFLFRAIPRWQFGDRIDVVADGAGRNITRTVVRYGSEQLLKEHDDGDNQ